MLLYVSRQQISRSKCGPNGFRYPMLEIGLYHLNPSTIPENFRVAGTVKTIVVKPGDFLGEICPPRGKDDPERGKCDSDITSKEDGDFGHLAVEFRFRETEGGKKVLPAHFDPLEALVAPECLYDKYQNAIPPSADEDLRNFRSPFQSCPLDFDQR